MQEIYLTGPVGWADDDGRGFDAVSVNKQLGRLNDAQPLTVYVNSPGGSVSEGVAVKTRLERYKGELSIYIEGLAASAATIICSAVNATVTMAKGSLLMIHNSLTYSSGHRQDLQKDADTLAKIDGEMRDIYVKRTGLPPSRVQQMMDEETWLTADEALALGFIDKVDNSKEVQALACAEGLVIMGSVRFNPKDFAKFPAAVRPQADINSQEKNQMTENSQKPEAAPAVLASVADFQAAYPGLYQELCASVLKAERERLQAIDAYRGQCSEELLADAKYAHPITAEQCAVKILQEQRAALTTQAAKLQFDGAQAAAQLQTIENTTMPEAVQPGDDNDPGMQLMMKALEKITGGC